MLNPISNSAINSIAENNGKGKNFETVKRNFEKAYASGGDYSTELMHLSTAVAYSVIAKCIDPQRKTAVTSGDISKKGYDPTLVALRQGIAADVATLENTRRITENTAAHMEYNADGDYITVTDKDTETALSKLIDITLTDGIDLVQTAACALIEQAAEHASGEKWLDIPYMTRRLNKKVYIKSIDSASAYKNEKTTPIQEIYRAVRRQIMSSRAVQTDPRNGYTYIEDLTADGLDTVYLRMGKYADIGGYNNDGNYTASIADMQDYETMLSKLNLTAKQATIINLRMQGYGYKAISTYLGVTSSSIAKTCKSIQKKAAGVLDLPDYLTAENDRAEKAKLSESDKQVMRKMHNDGYTMAYIAIHFNVSKMTVSRIINGRHDREKK